MRAGRFLYLTLIAAAIHSSMGADGACSAQVPTTGPAADQQAEEMASFLPESKIERGDIYRTGALVKQDYRQAVYWYEQAVKQNNGLAMGRLGYMHAHGLGMPVDLGKAVYFYKMGASLGDGDSLNNLGDAYQRGSGIGQDLPEALRCYREAADEAGNAAAMANLGYLYSQGLGVQASMTEAARWYRKAADRGNAVAMYNLGRLLETRRAMSTVTLKFNGGERIVGPAPDEDARTIAAAFEWYLAAARAGDETSMCKVAEMYDDGR